jgi:hypothetical protein
MAMAVIRRILVAVIAILVVVLPITGEAIVSASAAKVMMADDADMPCCPCCDTQANSKSTACVLKCVALAGAVLPAMTVTPRYLVDGSPLSFVGDTFHGLVRTPPTPPPI